jgi:hypothetical protein
MRPGQAAQDLPAVVGDGRVLGRRTRQDVAHEQQQVRAGTGRGEERRVGSQGEQQDPERQIRQRSGGGDGGALVREHDARPGVPSCETGERNRVQAHHRAPDRAPRDDSPAAESDLRHAKAKAVCAQRVRTFVDDHADHQPGVEGKQRSTGDVPGRPAERHSGVGGGDQMRYRHP